MIVIDLMHNLILGEIKSYRLNINTNLRACPIIGLVKHHFYHMWILKNIVHPKHELELLHSLLENVSLLHLFLSYWSDIVHT